MEYGDPADLEDMSSVSMIDQTHEQQQQFAIQAIQDQFQPTLTYPVAEEVLPVYDTRHSLARECSQTFPMKRALNTRKRLPTRLTNSSNDFALGTFVDS